MIELAVLATFGVALFVVVLSVALLAMLAVVVRVLFWLVLLPFRIAFALLVLPLLLIKAFAVVAGGLLFLIVGPLFAVAVIVGAVVVAALFALPLAPVLLLLFAIWMLTRPRRAALIGT